MEGTILFDFVLITASMSSLVSHCSWGGLVLIFVSFFIILNVFIIL
jgi:hypothetical protein